MRKVLVIVVSLFLVILVVVPARAADREVNIFLPDVAEGEMTALTTLEQQLDIHFTAVTWYQDWSHAIDADTAQAIHNHGAIPVLTWEPQLDTGGGISNTAVLDGRYDQYLIDSARTIQSLDFPIRINLAPEMNGDWSPWAINKNGNTAENSIAFWRYVVEMFRRQGAVNVQWIWCPNILPGSLTNTYQPLYPGDQWVDYLGLDGYNWGLAGTDQQWQSFSQVFAASYNTIAQVGTKPILVMETASTETGGNKARWITDMFHDLPTAFPRIQGITWFNENKETDWRIESSKAGLRAFTLGARQYLNLVATPLPIKSPPVRQPVPSPISKKNVPTPGITPFLLPSPLATSLLNPSVALRQLPAPSPTLVNQSAQTLEPHPSSWRSLWWHLLLRLVWPLLPF